VSDVHKRMAELSPQQRERLELMMRQRRAQSAADPAQRRGPGAAPVPSSSSPSLVCPNPRPHANARVLLVPHAGGGAAVYRSWHAQFPDHVESWALRLPGREGRSNEQPARRMRVLALDLAQELSRWIDDRPFVMFGHSMGALLTFEIARQLRRQRDRAPSHLFLASYRAPQTQRPSEIRRHHSEQEVVERFMVSNQVSRAMAQELVAMLRPIVEADVEMCETYEYEAELPLEIPISVSRGVRDYVTDEDILEWSSQTGTEFQARTFTGDHFFINQHSRVLVQDLATAAQRGWLSTSIGKGLEI
jgi:medium-chain acyl-[acyl-carrier-protein] hydrolase